MSDSMNAIDVTFRTEVSIENKSTEQLAAEVNVRYHQAEGLANMSAMMLADAGRRLIEIKGRIPHGQFESWCAENLEFSKSKAEKMMKLAERVDDENSLFSKTETFTDIGISRIWALLAAPEEVAAEVIETHDVTDMTVRELKDEIAKLKNEKAAAEGDNDILRKELHGAQSKLAEAVTKDDMDQIAKDFAGREDELKAEIRESKARELDIQAKLDKAKEDLKKLKAKQKELEAAKDEEVQRAVEEAKTDIAKRAKDDAHAEFVADLEQNAKDIANLQGKVEKLEAEKAKLSNTALMEFKVYVDQLQDIYGKLNDMITEESLEDEELGNKMRTALQTVVGRWRP